MLEELRELRSSEAIRWYHSLLIKTSHMPWIIFVARIHGSLPRGAQMVANIVFFVVSEHASCGSETVTARSGVTCASARKRSLRFNALASLLVDNRSSRNASL